MFLKTRWRRQRGRSGGHQHTVDLPSDVTLQTAHDLQLTLALCGTPSHVLSGALISPHPHHADHVQRAVGVSVATPVEPMSSHLARRGFYGRNSTQARERRLAFEPLGIVSGYDEECRGVVCTDGREGEKI